MVWSGGVSTPLPESGGLKCVSAKIQKIFRWVERSEGRRFNLDGAYNSKQTIDREGQ